MSGSRVSVADNFSPSSPITQSPPPPALSSSSSPSPSPASASLSHLQINHMPRLPQELLEKIASHANGYICCVLGLDLSLPSVRQYIAIAKAAIIKDERILRRVFAIWDARESSAGRYIAAREGFLFGVERIVGDPPSWDRNCMRYYSLRASPLEAEGLEDLYDIYIWREQVSPVIYDRMSKHLSRTAKIVALSKLDMIDKIDEADIFHMEDDLDSLENVITELPVHHAAKVYKMYERVHKCRDLTCERLLLLKAKSLDDIDGISCKDIGMDIGLYLSLDEDERLWRTVEDIPCNIPSDVVEVLLKAYFQPGNIHKRDKAMAELVRRYPYQAAYTLTSDQMVSLARKGIVRRELLLDVGWCISRSMASLEGFLPEFLSSPEPRMFETVEDMLWFLREYPDVYLRDVGQCCKFPTLHSREIHYRKGSLEWPEPSQSLEEISNDLDLLLCALCA